MNIRRRVRYVYFDSFIGESIRLTGKEFARQEKKWTLRIARNPKAFALSVIISSLTDNDGKLIQKEMALVRIEESEEARIIKNSMTINEEKRGRLA